MSRFAFILCATWILSVAAHASPKVTEEFNAVLAKTVNLDHGAELFQTCAACHGANGGGSANGDVPRIAGQHFEVIVRQLVDYRHDSRWDIRMEHYAGRKLLDDTQSIADVAGYISQLSGDEVRNIGNGELTRHGA